MKEEIVKNVNEAINIFKQLRDRTALLKGPSAGRILVIADSSPELNLFLHRALALDHAVILRLPGAVTPQPWVELLRALSLLEFYKCQKVVLFVGNKNEKIYQELSQITEDRGVTVDEWKKWMSSPRCAIEQMMYWVENYLEKSGKKGFLVLGLLLDGNSGEIEWVEKESTDKVRAERYEKTTSQEAFPELPLPVLPEIEFPPIPELDLSVLENPPPPRPKKITYGTGEKSGPIAFAQVMTMLPFEMADQKLSGVSFQPFEQPSAPEHQPQLSPRPSVQPVPDVKPQRIIDAIPAERTETFSPVTNLPTAKEHKVDTPREEPQKTPIVVVKKALTTATEPKPGLARGEAEPDLPQVFLEQGYIAADGLEQPIDASLQKALLRVRSFYLGEFSPAERQHIGAQIRSRATSGASSAELLKLVIAPVLKLGSKRYEVINDLLVMKEKLPAMQQKVTQAILEKVIL